MTKNEVKRMVKDRMNEGCDVIISIPVSAGFMGDMEAMAFYDAVKERMMEATNPLRTTSVARGGIKAFVYGETYKMEHSPGYLDKFVDMAVDFGEVQDVIGIKY